MKTASQVKWAWIMRVRDDMHFGMDAVDLKREEDDFPSEICVAKSPQGCRFEDGWFRTTSFHGDTGTLTRK